MHVKLCGGAVTVVDQVVCNEASLKESGYQTGGLVLMFGQHCTFDANCFTSVMSVKGNKS